MNKQIYKVSILFTIAVVVLVLLPFCINTAKKAFADGEYGTQTSSIVKALKFQAEEWSKTGHESNVNADSQTVSDDLSDNLNNQIKTIRNDYPTSFDLRNCDLDGTGENKNYVTSVKLQNPWGTCYAFGAIAASETSILSKLRKNSWYVDNDGKKRDTIDLSERHLSWFNYTPMTAEETPNQDGEGANSVTVERCKKSGEHGQWWPSQRLKTGGNGLSIISMFSQGCGPAEEPNWDDPNLSEIQKQLLYVGKNHYMQKDERNFDVYSRDDDWSMDNSLRFKHEYELDNAYKLPDAAVFDKDGKYSIENADYVTKLMKEQLMDGRAVIISYNCDTYTKDQADHRYPKYMNIDTWGEYSYEKGGPEHCVTVVGWDDNFSKSKFLTEIPDLDEQGHPKYGPDGKMIMKKVNQPPKDGAWIIKNSWGAKDSIAQGLSYEPYGIDDGGYFYLSYYDQSISDEVAFDYNVDTSNKEDKITHQTNYMPCESFRNIEQKDSVSSANVFCAEQDENINELSCITSMDNEHVTYKLYLLDSKDQRIDNGKLLCTLDQDYRYRGFHRAVLGENYKVNKGQYFAVVLTCKNKDNYLLECWYDCNHAGYDKKMTWDNYYCNGVVNPGESFLYSSKDDKWTDLSIIKKDLESSEEGKYFTYDNFAIKAYATPIKQPDIPGGDITPANNVNTDSSAAASTWDNTFDFIFALLAILGFSSLLIFIINKKLRLYSI